jgi:hypothetical protein
MRYGLMLALALAVAPLHAGNEGLREDQQTALTEEQLAAIREAHRKLQEAAAQRDAARRASDQAVLESSAKLEEDRLQSQSAQTFDERRRIEDQRRRDALLQAQKARDEEVRMHLLLKKAVESHLGEEIQKAELARREAEKARRDEEERQREHARMLAQARAAEEARLKELARQQEFARKRDELTIKQLMQQQEHAVKAAEKLRLAAETRLRELEKLQEATRRKEEGRLVDISRKQADAIKKTESEQAQLVARVNEAIRREQAQSIAAAMKREELVRAKLRFDQEMAAKRAKLGLPALPTSGPATSEELAIAGAPAVPGVTVTGAPVIPKHETIEIEGPPATEPQVVQLEVVLEQAARDCQQSGARPHCAEIEIGARSSLMQARTALERGDEAAARAAVRGAKGAILSALAHRW